MVFHWIVGDVGEDQVVVLVRTEDSCDAFRPGGHNIRVGALLESFLDIGARGISEAPHKRTGSGNPMSLSVRIVPDDIPGNVPILGDDKCPGFDNIARFLARIFRRILDARSFVEKKWNDLKTA